MKHFTLIAAAAGLLLCFTACFNTKENAASTSEKKITVVSWNIHGAIGTDNVFSLPRIGEHIKMMNADVAGLQEVDQFRKKTNRTNMPKSLSQLTSMHSYFYAALTDKDKTGLYGNALLSRLPATCCAHLKLPVAPENEPRTATVYQINEPQKYYAIVTHLSWQPQVDSERQGMLAFITDYVKANCADAPVVLLGDLNCHDNCPPIAFLRANNWGIANDVKPGMTFPADDPQVTLDYIAFYPVDAFKVKTFEIDSDSVSSDHRMIRAELLFLK